MEDIDGRAGVMVGAASTREASCGKARSRLRADGPLRGRRVLRTSVRCTLSRQNQRGIPELATRTQSRMHERNAACASREEGEEVDCAAFDGDF